MEARPTQKQVITSSLFWESYDNVYVQGLDLFGFYQAELYANKIKSILYELDQTYPYYPECRHLATKSRMYRNIILDSHLIIYRITEERIEVLDIVHSIEVLDIVHSASSMRKIKKTRNIHIE
ncbi:MAG: plasmid stabilization protein ParE [Bacteroidales bacterium 43_36]|nr:MAG: plasmid stabilization protein ParE [Bacteroidales bacterium 43_36]